jgi:hypothetical protein
MPAASGRAEPPELATERSSFRPAASWNPMGRPRFCAGGWALLCDAGLRGAGRCGVVAATCAGSVPTTAVDTTVLRSAGMSVDEELVLNEVFGADDAPGYGTG